jgi:hypothetical protein
MQSFFFWRHSERPWLLLLLLLLLVVFVTYLHRLAAETDRVWFYLLACVWVLTSRHVLMYFL